MKRATADDALRRAARGGDNEIFYAVRALLGLGKDFPPDLVRIVLRRLHDAKIPLLPSCRKWPDAALPLLLEVLDGPERVFLDAFAPERIDRTEEIVIKPRETTVKKLAF